jgi:hypothetical protein
MPDPPKAHRRLVPRKPKAADDEPTKQAHLRPPDHLEETKERPAIAAGLEVDDLEVTSRRMPAPPSPDDVSFDDLGDETTNALVDPIEEEHDAAETFAIPIQRIPGGSFILHAAREDDIPEQVPKASRPSVPIFEKQRGLPLGLDAASAKFRPSAPGPGFEEPLLPVRQVHDPDPDAFADLEPTALKHPHSLDLDAEDRPTTHISPAERGLLAAMSEGHEASRTVYMQWLERRGEKQRAEYLKLDNLLATMNPLDLRFQETQDRLRETATKISVDWRSRVARSLIENCGQSACPRYWRSLPAETDDVRHCKMCNTQVFYCASIELARHYAAGGQPVAIDVSVERRANDLSPHCPACANVVPPGTRFCPHCGRSMY